MFCTGDQTRLDKLDSQDAVAIDSIANFRNMNVVADVRDLIFGYPRRAAALWTSSLRAPQEGENLTETVSMTPATSVPMTSSMVCRKLCATRECGVPRASKCRRPTRNKHWVPAFNGAALCL